MENENMNHDSELDFLEKDIKDDSKKEGIKEEERSFKRMNRKKYLIENAKLLGLILILGILSFVSISTSSLFDVMMIVNIVIGLGIAIYQFYINLCRLHDINISGMWYIPMIIINVVCTYLINAQIVANIIGWVLTIVLLVVKGTEGPNKFGEDPLSTNMESYE